MLGLRIVREIVTTVDDAPQLGIQHLLFNFRMHCQGLTDVACHGILGLIAIPLEKSFDVAMVNTKGLDMSVITDSQDRRRCRGCTR